MPEQQATPPDFRTRMLGAGTMGGGMLATGGLINTLGASVAEDALRETDLTSEQLVRLKELISRRGKDVRNIPIFPGADDFAFSPASSMDFDAVHKAVGEAAETEAKRQNVIAGLMRRPKIDAAATARQAADDIIESIRSAGGSIVTPGSLPPSIMAHELGHASARGSLLQRGYMAQQGLYNLLDRAITPGAGTLARGVPGLAAARFLVDQDDPTGVAALKGGLGGAAAGGLFHVPTLGEEIRATWRGTQALKKMPEVARSITPTRSLLKALGTYGAAATLPAAALGAGLGILTPRKGRGTMEDAQQRIQNALAKTSAFQSQAQRRKFYAMEDSGEISKDTLDEWEGETPKGKKLPEKKKEASMDEKSLVSDLPPVPAELRSVFESVAKGQPSRSYGAEQASWLSPLRRLRSTAEHNELRQYLIDRVASEMGEKPWGSAPGYSNPAVHSKVQELIGAALQKNTEQGETKMDEKSAQDRVNAFKAGFFKKVAELGLTPSSLERLMNRIDPDTIIKGANITPPMAALAAAPAAPAAAPAMAPGSVYPVQQFIRNPQLAQMSAAARTKRQDMTGAIRGLTMKKKAFSPLGDVASSAIQTGGELVGKGIDTGKDLAKLSLLASVMVPLLAGGVTGASHGYLTSPQSEDIDAMKAQEQIALYRRLADEARRKAKRSARVA
jgi:hypothetical protein